jgi:hypothetical protein
MSPTRWRLGWLVVICVLSIATAPPSRAATPAPAASTATPSARNWSALQPPATVSLNEIPPGMQQLATAVVLENLPETYEDTDDWGGTRERFDGLKVRLDGAQVRTKRKRKTVNHGTWKRYQITQIAPQENLRVEISPIATLDDGRAAFTVELATKLNAVAQLTEWNNGVRLLSMTIDADADIRIQLACQLDIQLDPGRFPPDLVLKPEVTEAKIRLADLHVNRLSHFDGPVVRELGDGLRSVVQARIREKQPKLTEKINRQIARHQDDLRISLHDAWKKRWDEFSTTRAAEPNPLAEDVDAL